MPTHCHWCDFWNCCRGHWFAKARRISRCSYTVHLITGEPLRKPKPGAGRGPHKNRRQWCPHWQQATATKRRAWRGPCAECYRLYINGYRARTRGAARAARRQAKAAA